MGRFIAFHSLAAPLVPTTQMLSSARRTPTPTPAGRISAARYCSAKRPFSCRWPVAFCTRKVFLLLIKTCSTTPLIMSPMTIATISSIRLKPLCARIDTPSDPGHEGKLLGSTALHPFFAPLHNDCELIAILNHPAVALGQLLSKVGAPLGQVTLKRQAGLLRRIARQLGTDCNNVITRLSIATRGTHAVAHFVGQEGGVGTYGRRLIGLERVELQGGQAQQTNREEQHRYQHFDQRSALLQAPIH